MKKLLAPILLCCGCAAPAAVSTTETTSGTLRPIRVVATEPAIDDITRTECERAQACGAVVSLGIYRDSDYCSTEINRAVRDELLTPGCGYIDRAGIATCLDAIRHETCADLNFTERAPSACRHAALCR